MDQDQARRTAAVKATRRLVPFLCLCYMVNFLDRVNVGFAALAMNEDLGFSPSVFGAGALLLGGLIALLFGYAQRARSFS